MVDCSSIAYCSICSLTGGIISCTNCQSGYTVANPSLCQPICLYDCFTCLNPISCSTCNVPIDNRVIDALTLRCFPIDGYYDGIN